MEKTLFQQVMLHLKAFSVYIYVPSCQKRAHDICQQIIMNIIFIVRLSIEKKKSDLFAMTGVIIVIYYY